MLKAMRRSVTAAQEMMMSNSQSQLYMICALIYLNSTMAGLDASLIGNLNALPEFKRSFGLDTSLDASRITGVIFASMQIGGIIGALFLWIADKKGRKFCIRIGSLGVIVGAALQGSSNSVSRLVFGRFFLGFFSTLACRSSSIYLVELAPTAQRGTIAGLYNTLFFFGSLLATGSVLYCQTMFLSTEYAWRIPLWCQTICPTIVALGIGFVPESPRWLFANGHRNKAREVLFQLHGEENDELISKELSQMSEDLKLNASRDVASWRSMITGPGRRHRLFILVCMAVFGHSSGNNVISYYLPTMVAEIGIKSLHTKLLLNALYAIVGWGAAAAGAFFHDIHGRRKMLFSSTIGLSICMLILTISSTIYGYYPSILASSISIGSIYIFGVVFAMGFTSMQPVYPSEIMTNDMRARGMAIATIAGGTAGFVNNLIAPVALLKYGHLYYLFFVFWDLVEATVIHKYFVETKGWSLEELVGVFESQNPVLASMNKPNKSRIV